MLNTHNHNNNQAESAGQADKFAGNPLRMVPSVCPDSRALPALPTSSSSSSTPPLTIQQHYSLMLSLYHRNLIEQLVLPAALSAAAAAASATVIGQNSVQSSLDLVQKVAGAKQKRRRRRRRQRKRKHSPSIGSGQKNELGSEQEAETKKAKSELEGSDKQMDGSLLDAKLAPSEDHKHESTNGQSSIKLPNITT